MTFSNSISDSSVCNPHRLFVGVSLPIDVKQIMDTWKDSIRQALPFQKWTHPEDVHITLFFLGDTTAEVQDKLAPDLRQLAAATPPLTLHAEGLGVFGPPAAPSILWAGVAGDLDALRLLQREVEAACARQGFKAESRAYRPHITLARRYRGAGPFQRAALTQAPPDGGWPSWRAEDIVLYRSHIGRQPAYEPVGVFPLGGNA